VASRGSPAGCFRGALLTEPVYSASEALKRAASFKPDVVLLDIGHPEMDGYEVARRLRALPDFGAVRLGR
jgi:CheY-like chemotaxis protein